MKPKYLQIYFFSMIIILICFFSSNVSSIDYEKEYALNFIPDQYKLKHYTGCKNKMLELSGKIKFPIIVKPNKCTTGGKGVIKVKDIKEYIRIINKFQSDDIMVQEFDDSPYECSILYERWPFLKKGKIITITKKVLTEDKINYNNATCKFY